MANSTARKTEAPDRVSDRIKVREPFGLENENHRKFVRIDIGLPVAVKQIKDRFGNFIPEDDIYAINGSILNISATGMLVDLEAPVDEEDVVLIRFCLQEVETLDNVLGVVKRMEYDGDRYLVGVEFIGKEELRDRLSEDQFEQVSDSVMSFENRVRETLIKYLY